MKKKAPEKATKKNPPGWDGMAEAFADAQVIHEDNEELLKMSKTLKGRRKQQADAQLELLRSGDGTLPIYREIVLKHEKEKRKRIASQNKGRKTQQARKKAHWQEVIAAFEELRNRIEIIDGREWPLHKIYNRDVLIEMLVEERHHPPKYYTPPRNDRWGLATVIGILKPKKG